MSKVMRDAIVDRSFATTEGFKQGALGISALQQQVGGQANDTTSSFGTATQQPSSTMKELRRNILSLSAHDMADLFLKNEMLRSVSPLVQGIQQLIEVAGNRGQQGPPLYPRHLSWPISTSFLEMDRVPLLTFGWYNLNNEVFLVFLRDFNTIANAYATLEAY